MFNGLIGKKLGMTGLFTPEGQYVPVTVIEAGPCVVTQIKTVATDGYDALQLGFGEKKELAPTNPCGAILKRAGANAFAISRSSRSRIREITTLGRKSSLTCFRWANALMSSGQSKGRGFAGVIKRHGFHGGSKTHGSKAIGFPVPSAAVLIRPR